MTSSRFPVYYELVYLAPYTLLIFIFLNEVIMSYSTNPSTISADDLHKILMKTYAIGNLARRRFISALYAMDSSKLYIKLGFSSIFQYTEKHFLCSRSQVYEFLAVAKALEYLPLCDRAFTSGKLSWSILRDIAKAIVLSKTDPPMLS